MRIIRTLLSVSLLIILSGLFLTSSSRAQDNSDLPQFNVWNIRDPHDNALPNLIKSNGDSLSLDSNWQVSSIEYLFEWWGLGDPVFDYQAIRREGNDFKNGDSTVKASAVQDLVTAIRDLHPIQSLVGGNDHTDDYPSWTVELTGVGGQHILLSSSSTSSQGAAPWNILSNGRLYAMFEDHLGQPLANLFNAQSGQPATVLVPGGATHGMLGFATEGLPRQLSEGFSGLLPIADNFQYQADEKTGIIAGFIQGRESIGGFGHMVIGTITDLNQVEIKPSAGTPVSCKVEVLPNSDPAGKAWQFSCDMGQSKAGEAFRYGITVSFDTSDSQIFTTQGELNGIWGQAPNFLSLPADEPIQQALAQNKDAKDLLSDHILAYTSYQAEINPQDTTKGIYTGEAVFVGETTMDNHIIRFTVGTPFVIQDGSLTHWDLRRDALDSMLNDIGQSPLTSRAIETDDTIILNLWYAESGDMPEMDYLINANPTSYGVGLAAECGHERQSFPSSNTPLRAFSFNSSWSFQMPDFILVDDKPVVANLDLWPQRAPRGAVENALIPSQLKNDTGRDFQRIWLQNTPFLGSDTVELTLWLPDDASKAEIDNYRHIVQTLGGLLNTKYDPDWTIIGVKFVVNEKGDVEITSCRKP